MGKATFVVDRGEWFKLLYDELRKRLPYSTSIDKWETEDHWDTITFTIEHIKLPNTDEPIQIANPLNGPQFIVVQPDARLQCGSGI